MRYVREFSLREIDILVNSIEVARSEQDIAATEEESNLLIEYLRTGEGSKLEPKLTRVKTR